MIGIQRAALCAAITAIPGIAATASAQSFDTVLVCAVLYDDDYGERVYISDLFRGSSNLVRETKIAERTVRKEERQSGFEDTSPDWSDCWTSQNADRVRRQRRDLINEAERDGRDVYTYRP